MDKHDALQHFEQYLQREEKSRATTEKYRRDIRCFLRFLDGRTITKERVIAYKDYLCGLYAAASVNSMLVALNAFLRFVGEHACCVKLLKIQRQIFCSEDKELSREEYRRLLRAAGNTQIAFVLQTICGTGIRVSELQFITVQAVLAGKAVVNCKNKTRVIFIPAPLQSLLKSYIKKRSIRSGPVFVSPSGAPLDRIGIWRKMKALCGQAAVSPCKVFPHNLRHLFARTFYSVEKDIVCLADLLGHSSINTTRIYTVETGRQHVLRLEKVQLALTT